MDRRELDEILEKIDASKILDVKVKEELEKSFIAYAMAVNVSRAIPDVLACHSGSSNVLPI